MEMMKIIDELMGEVDKKMCLDSPKEAEIYRNILKKSIQKAKKEVFDDIENSSVQVPLFHSDCNCEWCKIKKKHLQPKE